jgi:hypothetical protein
MSIGCPSSEKIRSNPVKHGLVEHPADWPFVVAPGVANGLYPTGWMGGGDEPREESGYVAKFGDRTLMRSLALGSEPRGTKTVPRTRDSPWSPFARKIRPPSVVRLFPPPFQ